MEQHLSKLKSWWFLVFFIGTLIVTWTGTFTNGDGDTVTVKNGIITDVS